MLTLVGFAVGFLVLLIGLVQLFKFILEKGSKKILSANVPSDGLIKKHHDVDISKYSRVLFNVGLMVSLGLTIMAFEWKDYEERELMDLGNLDAMVEDVLEIPPTEQKTPPPPAIVQPEIIEVPDEEEIEDDIEVDLNVEVDQETVVQQVVAAEEPEEEEEVVDEIFTVVEDGAKPIGGYAAFYKFISKKIKYPKQAKRMGIEGKVYVQFVVNKDGSLTDVKAIKGIGGGCDEEAARVVAMAAKWKPGKQRGVPVKQRIVMPINFTLN